MLHTQYKGARTHTHARTHSTRGHTRTHARAHALFDEKRSNPNHAPFNRTKKKKKTMPATTAKCGQAKQYCGTWLVHATQMLRSTAVHGVCMQPRRNLNVLARQETPQRYTGMRVQHTVFHQPCHFHFKLRQWAQRHPNQVPFLPPQAPNRTTQQHTMPQPHQAHNH